MGAQPADEADRPLRGSHDRPPDEIRGLRHRLPSPVAAGPAALDPLFYLHLILKPELFHFPFRQQRQVVREALELPVRTFRLLAARPGFALLHLPLKLVEHFLDVPPAFVDDAEQVRRQCHLVGEVGVMRPVARIGVGDAALFKGIDKMHRIPLSCGLRRVGGDMRKARWLAEWAGKQGKPAIYHCISRVVDRRFVFGDAEREHFRIQRDIFKGTDKMHKSKPKV